MEILYSESFKKRFGKLPLKIQNKFGERIELFIKNPNSPLLKIHPLNGTLAGYRAFSVSGDYRVIYRILAAGKVKLINIDTYNQVY